MIFRNCRPSIFIMAIFRRITYASLSLTSQLQVSFAKGRGTSVFDRFKRNVAQHQTAPYCGDVKVQVASVNVRSIETLPGPRAIFAERIINFILSVSKIMVGDELVNCWLLQNRVVVLEPHFLFACVGRDFE